MNWMRREQTREEGGRGDGKERGCVGRGQRERELGQLVCSGVCWEGTI